MIYYTGDIHGDPREIVQFCDRQKLTEQDTLVLLGDVGANYFLNRKDTEMKRLLTRVKPKNGMAGRSGWRKPSPACCLLWMARSLIWRASVT